MSSFVYANVKAIKVTIIQAASQNGHVFDRTCMKQLADFRLCASLGET